MLSKTIGIISYLPDEQPIRNIRKEKLINLLQSCDRIFPNIHKIIIAQNWKDDELDIRSTTNRDAQFIIYKEKLGITKARKELRKIFLTHTKYDYLIMLDDDCELFGEKRDGDTYLAQIDKHPNMFAAFKPHLLKLFAISRYMFNKFDYKDEESEKGEIFEDMYLHLGLRTLYPDREFYFINCTLRERSDSAWDVNSTWYHNQFNKHDIGDKTRASIKLLKEQKEQLINNTSIKNNVCIGIISWFPDINTIRGVRIRRLQNLINQCNLLLNLPIIIIAQNWNDNEIYITDNITVYNYNKLGITGARKELRKKFLESEYDKIIMLDDDMELFNSKDNFKKYLELINKFPAIEYENFLCNLFAISKDLFSKLDYDNIEAEKNEGYEDWIYISKLKKEFPNEVAKLTGLKLIPYNRHDLVNDRYSTWKTANTKDLTEESRKIIYAK